jgi:hypothetical protein
MDTVYNLDASTDVGTIMGPANSWIKRIGIVRPPDYTTFTPAQKNNSPYLFVLQSTVSSGQRNVISVDCLSDPIPEVPDYLFAQGYNCRWPFYGNLLCVALPTGSIISVVTTDTV